MRMVLRGLSYLETLHMDLCELSTLPSAIGALHQLKSLSLFGNNIVNIDKVV